MPQKKNLTTKSITKVDLVGVDDTSSIIIRTYMFPESHIYKAKQKTLYQYNKSTILLQEYGKNSLSNSTRNLNIRYLPLMDQGEK